MNYYSVQPRLICSVVCRELMSQELAMQDFEISTCRKQVAELSGAYTVAVQMSKDR